MDDVFISIEGRSVGPLTIQDVEERLRAGEIDASTPAVVKGASAWVTVRELPGVDVTLIPPSSGDSIKGAGSTSLAKARGVVATDPTVGFRGFIDKVYDFRLLIAGAALATIFMRVILPENYGWRSSDAMPYGPDSLVLEKSPELLRLFFVVYHNGNNAVLGVVPNLDWCGIYGFLAYCVVSWLKGWIPKWERIGLILLPVVIGMAPIIDKYWFIFWGARLYDTQQFCPLDWPSYNLTWEGGGLLSLTALLGISACFRGGRFGEKRQKSS